MALRLLYALKTTDQDYLRSFHPARRLTEAAKDLGLDFQARLYPLIGEAEPPSPLLDWAAGQRILVRGDLPQPVYQAIEAVAARLINPLPAASLCTDKLATAQWLARLGARHPPTRPYTGQADAALLGWPLVAKPRYGKKGYRVELIPDAAALEAYAPDRNSLVQAYVSGRPGSDIRFFFAAFSQEESRAVAGLSQGPRTDPSLQAAMNAHPERPGLYSLAVLRQAEGFRSNAAQGGRMRLFRPGRELLAEAGRLFLASGLVYGTVDFLFDDPAGLSYSVCELNGCPGFEELERACPVNAAQAILRSALA